MLHILGTIALVMVLFAILLFGAYVTLFPLFSTITGGIRILGAYRWERFVESLRREAGVATPALGVTMADGGDRVDE
jgi:hypothetical protein